MQRPMNKENYRMDKMEKVEKIRELANVSFEEAKAALEENNWDLLETMVALEHRGKVKKLEKAASSVTPEMQQYYPVKETGTDSAGKRSRGGKVRNAFKRIVRFCRENTFHVTRGEKEIIKAPVMLLIVTLLFFWELLAPVMVIALFFNIRYHFSGKDDLKSVNEFMDSASNMASCMKSEFAQRADDEPADKAEENMGEPAEEIVEVNAGEKTEETPDADAAE